MLAGRIQATSSAASCLLGDRLRLTAIGFVGRLKR